MRPYVDQLVNKCHNYGLDFAAASPTNKSLELYSELVELHRQLILTEHNWAITHSLYERVVEDAIAFDDVQNARAAHSGWYFASFICHSSRVNFPSVLFSFGNRETLTFLIHREVYWSVRARRTWPGHVLVDKLEYLWHVIAREPLYRLLAVAFAILSIITVWSEITWFSENPVLSVRLRLRFSCLVNACVANLTLALFVGMGEVDWHQGPVGGSTSDFDFLCGGIHHLLLLYESLSA